LHKILLFEGQLEKNKSKQLIEKLIKSQLK